MHRVSSPSSPAPARREAAHPPARAASRACDCPGARILGGARSGGGCAGCQGRCNVPSCCSASRRCITFRAALGAAGDGRLDGRPGTPAAPARRSPHRRQPSGRSRADGLPSCSALVPLTLLGVLWPVRASLRCAASRSRPTSPCAALRDWLRGDEAGSAAPRPRRNQRRGSRSSRRFPAWRVSASGRIR